VDADDDAPMSVSRDSDEDEPSEPAQAHALQPTDIDAIARAVVSRLSERVLREIAWDVVPDLAEMIVRERIKDLERVAEEKAARCAELEADIRGMRARGEDGGDDLKLIRGIGPAFERELKRIGVRTFDQIAAWTETDVEQIGPKIKARPERIKRDDWIKKAAALAAARLKP
jgi:predicted flap endonuclease-1-like 5' DNA nuclease